MLAVWTTEASAESGDPKPGTMSLSERGRQRARWGALAVSVAFALQLVYITIAEEPYPAIMMPRFSWAGPTDAAKLDIMVPEIVISYADSTTRTLTQRELLHGLPVGHHSNIMTSMFAPVPAGGARRAPAGKFEPPAWLFPGYNLARVSRDDPERKESLRTWLRQRASEGYDKAPPTKFVVNWYDDSFPYDVHSERPPERLDRVLQGTFEIDLHAEAR